MFISVSPSVGRNGIEDIKTQAMYYNVKNYEEDNGTNKINFESTFERNE